MEYTGERVIPKIMNPKNGMLLEHLDRYVFAKDYCKGRVLDIACGAGYGSELLLDHNDAITEYVGIDIDDETIAYAKANYTYPRTKYYTGDALDQELPNKHGTFDTIVSFETIEHFYGDELFIENLYHLLKPGGTLVISTPFGRGKDFPCKSQYHVYQYTEDEFLDVLKPFKEITMFHQVDRTIEMPKPDKKYYLMVAVCKK
ncbi:methyltransferase family protein [Natranaerovirga hydrolytica]|uniref:Methyltransferase family protein n=1 Tax=Natranaerovirga hydrolytica TaxID=680378 RepID=A0A4R1N029_9FIRM|nr:class I SAM-dependent methyltransferase [Natranaerovirga hydrolytica]TCK98192.1 methyltransferase family protein [Natranaerovirga hydrolytica]